MAKYLSSDMATVKYFVPPVPESIYNNKLIKLMLSIKNRIFNWHAPLKLTKPINYKNDFVPVWNVCV